MTDERSESTCRSIWDFSEEAPSFREWLLERLLSANAAGSQDIGEQKGSGVLPGP